MSIIFDTRERDLHTYFPECIKKALHVGDVWIGTSDDSIQPGGIVMERKTVADLEASLTDGRYREQRTRLLAYCQEKKARAVYCIEGNLDRLYGKNTKEELWKILNRLVYRYGVNVFQTESLADTAKYITTLSEQIQKDPSVFIGQQLSYSDVTTFTKKGNKEDPKSFCLAVLQQCPGVSLAVSKALLEHFKTFPGIFSASVEDLEKIVVGKRKLGTVVSKRLYSLLHHTQETTNETTNE
jgi:ERCC4-type nuclease